MFKKMVASVSLSPSAVGELASYSKNLKKQRPYRIASTLLLLAALILQLVIIYFPPQSALPPPVTPEDIAVTRNQNGLRYSLEGRNISQGNADATKVRAQSSDQIIYTLAVKNTSDNAQTTKFPVDLRDMFDYASILSLNEGELNGSVLEWPEATIEPGEDQVRAFTIKMAKDISTAPTNGLAFDCKMTTAFGSVVDSVVRCSTVKMVETEMTSLPVFNKRTSLSILIVAFLTSFLLLLRNVQKSKEIKIIRKELAKGTL